MEHRTGRKRREWSKIRTAKRPRGPLPESQMGGMVQDQGMRVLKNEGKVVPMGNEGRG